MTTGKAPGKLGFIGAGALCEAVIHGMMRADKDGVEILVSPRSESISKRVAATYVRVGRAASNAEVVAFADVVFLACRPQQIDEALAGLAFRPGQIVASFLAKTSVDALRARIGPGPQICRVTPLTSIALRKGPIIFHPRVEPMLALFDGLGETIVAADEAEIMRLGVASGLLSTYFGFQAAVIDWLGRRDVRPETAALYVRAMLEGLAATGRATHFDELSELVARHETPDGLNERSRRRLVDVGWFKEIGRTLDMLDQRADLAPSAPRGLE